jgi:hypothetical protein
MTDSILAGSAGASLGLEIRGSEERGLASLSLEPEAARFALMARLARFSLLWFSRSLSLSLFG